MFQSRCFALPLASLLCFAPLLGGCSSAEDPAQTESFALADVQSIEVDYDGERVTIQPSDSDQITIIEYLNKNKKSYLAKIDLSSGILTVTEGARPIGNGVHAYIELYLPPAYQNRLALHTTNGQISSDLALTCSEVRADTTNGSITLSNLTTEQLHLTSTGGTISLNDLTAQSCTIDTTNADTQTNHLTGAVTYLSKGGNLTVTNASGSGNFQATGDGSMELAFTTVSGDLTAYTKNGDFTLTLTLPSSLNFIFSATTKEGSIQTPFSGTLSTTGNTVGGTIGNHAQVKVALETKEGEIVVKIQE